MCPKWPLSPRGDLGASSVTLPRKNDAEDGVSPWLLSTDSTGKWAENSRRKKKNEKTSPFVPFAGIALSQMHSNDIKQLWEELSGHLGRGCWAQGVHPYGFWSLSKDLFAARTQQCCFPLGVAVSRSILKVLASGRSPQTRL